MTMAHTTPTVRTSPTASECLNMASSLAADAASNIAHNLPTLARAALRMATGYLDLANETRRHLFTLGHAHGALLALVNLALAATFEARPGLVEDRGALASRCLIGASLLIPAGFLLGGMVIHAGDPGLGIAVLPLGAFLLVIALAILARGLWRR